MRRLQYLRPYRELSIWERRRPTPRWRAEVPDILFQIKSGRPGQTKPAMPTTIFTKA